jgi:molecular chaperone GrpE
MSNKDSSDSLDSLFADALKAVEKSKHDKPLPSPKEQEVPNLDLGIEIDVEVETEFEEHVEYSEASSESTTVNDDAYEALLESKAHLDMQYDQLRQQFRELQAENERLNQRLASAHTHMQTARDQLKKTREQQQHAQSKLEDQSTRIKMLEGTVERQKQQIEKNGDMRRKEKQEMQKYGASSTLKQLLPALDSLDLAVKNSEANPESLKEGLRLVQTQFTDALSSAGVHRVPSNPGDKFNPAHHEAVMRVPSDSIEVNHIVESFCGAYTLHDRLLRAAMVSVAAPK